MITWRTDTWQERPITWSDGKHEFAVSVINIGTRNKPKFKLQILCDGKTSRISRVKHSRKLIADQLLSKKEELNIGIKACVKVIYLADVFRFCYFWEGDNGKSSERAAYEREWSYPKTEWNDGENEWSVRYSVTRSRKHTYATGYYYKNAVLTNLTAVKHQLVLLNELVDMIDTALDLKEENSSDLLSES